MSVSVSFNGVTYALPTTNEVDWGAALTAFLKAVANNASTASKVETLTGKSISGASNTLSAIPNAATTATSTNTSEAIVARDEDGDFEVNAITAAELATGELAVSGTADVGTLQADVLQLMTDVLPNIPGGDSSSTPGAATLNKICGKSAIAVGQSSVLITNSLVRTDSIVLAVIQQAAADATLTRVERVAVTNGTFTIFGNANATAAVVVTWFIFKRS